MARGTFPAEADPGAVPRGRPPFQVNPFRLFDLGRFLDDIPLMMLVESFPKCKIRGLGVRLSHKGGYGTPFTSHLLTADIWGLGSNGTESTVEDSI